MEITKKFFSKAETAQVLGVSLATVNRRINDGTIPYRQLGSRVLIPVEAINRIANLSEKEGA